MIPQITKTTILNPKIPKEVKIVGWYLIISVISFFVYLLLLNFNLRGLKLNPINFFLGFEHVTPQDLFVFLLFGVPITIVEIYAVREVFKMTKKDFN